jgi:dephospho-CoA kinase
MIIVGLTGSIGMGKSTTAAMFAAEGAPVYDADAEVARLYARGGAAVEPLEAVFPGVVRLGAVDRAVLRERVLGDPAALKRLEAIVHPLLGASRAVFFREAHETSTPIVVLDIPLLFETGGERNVEAVVVVTAPEHVQRERVLAREGMTGDQLDVILAKQLHDTEKRARAHYVIDTGRGLDAARDQVRAVLADLRAKAAAKADAARLDAAGEPEH